MANLLSIPAAATYLAVSPKTVWDWIYAGTLPSIKLGGSRRIRQSALDEYIAQNEWRGKGIMPKCKSGPGPAPAKRRPGRPRKVQP